MNLIRTAQPEKSTAAEAIAARHMRMRVCGVSCVTNMGAGMDDEELSHDLVHANANKTSGEFTDLLHTLIERMPPAGQKRSGVDETPDIK